MPIAGRSHNPFQTPRILFDERAVGQALIVGGIAVAVLVLAVQCCRYLFIGTYFDHIEGNVVISGWQYAHGEPLYAIQDGVPDLRAITVPSPISFRFRHCCFSARMSRSANLPRYWRSSPPSISMGCYFLRNAARGRVAPRPLLSRRRIAGLYAGQLLGEARSNRDAGRCRCRSLYPELVAAGMGRGLHRARHKSEGACGHLPDPDPGGSVLDQRMAGFADCHHRRGGQLHRAFSGAGDFAA